jgi:hypothetical protein
MSMLPSAGGDYETPSVNYIIYEPDGRIVQAGFTPIEFIGALKGQNNILYLEDSFQTYDLTNKFVREGELADREELPGVQAEYTVTADGETEVIIDLPAGCTLYFEDQVHENESRIEFVTNTLGDYWFFIMAPAGYINKEVTIHAV